MVNITERFKKELVIELRTIDDDSGVLNIDSIFVDSEVQVFEAF